MVHSYLLIFELLESSLFDLEPRQPQIRDSSSTSEKRKRDVEIGQHLSSVRATVSCNIQALVKLLLQQKLVNKTINI